MDQLNDTLADLRVLETQLWTEHREHLEYIRLSFGSRYFDPEESTSYGRAADALNRLLGGIEDLLTECIEAEADAYAAGQPWGTSAVVRIGSVLEALTENLCVDVVDTPVS